ncbi:hypothetical protein HMSSN139_00530 [Paenibacillus sp. HMSSN-139]|nr:hypothetical protein HMSSN139_00530 [Paenibacillus sp. HMSSN-139]
MLELDAKLVRDDGAIVYLNGQEIFRTNMPAARRAIARTPTRPSATNGTGPRSGSIRRCWLKEPMCWRGRFTK